MKHVKKFTGLVFLGLVNLLNENIMLAFPREKSMFFLNANIKYVFIQQIFLSPYYIWVRYFLDAGDT